MINFDNFTLDKAIEYIGNNIDALVIADQEADSYKAIVRKGVFKELIEEKGTYKDIVQKLWFHFNNSDKTITEEYQVFIPNLSNFIGKYSQRLKILINDVTHIVQMTIFPINNSSCYLVVLNELDKNESIDDNDTQQKVSTIQNIYLFSMCFDLVRDTTSSLSLTEVSNETMNSQISYTEWRKTIVNMIWQDDKETFLKRSDPQYLREHFTPGHIESFDCQMQNLDGVFIWVKLIFSRMETTNENDFRFVYMVQNIHDTTVSMQETIRHYEDKASRDPLTKIYNHGRIETEINNALDKSKELNSSAALIVLDIDKFKEVNDNYGHAAGDTTLVKFTEIIREILKDHNAVFGRWGGEEFAAVIYDINNNELLHITEELRSRIESTNFQEVGKLTCSIGGTILNKDDTFDSWFNRADKALYSAKSNGRNCVNIL